MTTVVKERMQHDVPDIVLVIAVLVILVFILGRILPVTSQGHVVHFSFNPKLSKPNLNGVLLIRDVYPGCQIRFFPSWNLGYGS